MSEGACVRIDGRGRGTGGAAAVVMLSCNCSCTLSNGIRNEPILR